LCAQTALAAQVLGIADTAVQGIGAIACLCGQLAHAYWELDEEAIEPWASRRLQPVLEHLVARASRFVLVEQGRWRRRGSQAGGEAYPFEHTGGKVCGWRKTVSHECPVLSCRSAR